MDLENIPLLDLIPLYYTEKVRDTHHYMTDYKEHSQRPPWHYGFGAYLVAFDLLLHPEGLANSELVERLGMTKHQVAYATSVLTKKGLATRSRRLIKPTEQPLEPTEDLKKDMWHLENAVRHYSLLEGVKDFWELLSKF